MCITFTQRRPNVEDVVQTMYKCYANVLRLLGESGGVMVEGGGAAPLWETQGDASWMGKEIIGKVGKWIMYWAVKGRREGRRREGRIPLGRERTHPLKTTITKQPLPINQKDRSSIGFTTGQQLIYCPTFSCCVARCTFIQDFTWIYHLDWEVLNT